MTTKNALIRYRTIDRCLQNNGRQWALQDLIDACSDALYELEGRDVDVSKRTVQLDIQLMRSDKLGYNAPIEVYNRKYYRYADPDYKIANVPLTESDMAVLTESVTMLRQFRDFNLFNELNGVIQKLEDKVYRNDNELEPIIHIDKNESLVGLEHLDVLYQAIAKKVVVWIDYQSFVARKSNRFRFHGYLLKEFNNRWFLVGRKAEEEKLYTLALDRIKSISVDLRTDYVRRDFDATTYYRDTFGVTVIGNRPVPIRLRFDHHNAPYVLTKPLHHSQVSLPRSEDGSLEIKVTLQLNYEIERLILGFGEGVEVLAPKRLRKRIKGILKRAAGLYAPGNE
ncbi:YafY family protein [Lewinella sp. 4G2]|uniref:helix-turn-helix transcriptional regulator n=1 Tax=Lewinella sp. 4G2 TaxID=1803372 RepID=UPI0007B4B12F|nr:WYL domain-containing protein [Lewinella sp. 4G2]OAV44007.1 WYL domain-containing protein [Lewinella sp. 4G2]